MRPIPVLMYHHINLHKWDMVTITPAVFEGQMEYLYKAGYRTLKIDELISYMSGGLALPQKAVVVTFDDGWLDNYIYAFPVLKKYKINAAVFLITNRVENASLQNIVKDSIAWFKKRMLIYTNTILSRLYLKIKKK
ncbi:MAG: polysaccharide deacetylase family protein [Nitrospinae bacterium]|nr:polysaccharide deacetylase family protein [Nitrospinota bacterium]